MSASDWVLFFCYWIALSGFVAAICVGIARK